jgi:hypothetical protein
MNITDYSDWYRVSHNALAKEIGHGLLRRSGGLYGCHFSLPSPSLLSPVSLIFNSIGLLIRAYPEHKWDRERFEISNKRALQKLLKEVLTQIFVGYGRICLLVVLFSYYLSDVHEEYHHPKILSTETQETSPLDVYIPSLQLAFEYPTNIGDR